MWQAQEMLGEASEQTRITLSGVADSDVNNSKVSRLSRRRSSHAVVRVIVWPSFAESPCTTAGAAHAVPSGDCNEARGENQE